MTRLVLVLAAMNHLFIALVFFLLAILLAGCSSSRPLPVASGPVRQLNVGHWLPNTNDLTTPPDAKAGS